MPEQPPDYLPHGYDPENSPVTYGWRLTQMERRVTQLEQLEIHSALRRLDERFTDLHEDLVWLKRTLAGAIFTLLGGMILFLISITAGWI